ncbi:hemin receptor [Fusobacterium necrophorum subsp. funduliforme]|uniref:TonB-dependent receptor plug domain protein n=4 Tax=Fusobacterium necrophorum TaxID=859 RepID=A0AAN3VV70_9FUSO|nr:TonB-dependent receptor [Fusobacterium necrophorum]EJU16443.1 TonB-dependent receptor plug domain protein [Fusobacterium necrophorum subsp. funduliforme Fnf 1007]EYD68691.1 hemin receptor [Fusobacterium necrophorum subsp. funduliforme B35]KYL02235.1 hemin receptor [Fusobacterium necrophorum subsp. funduliforme]KYM37952.1 hemin receptor [Fusobacterium necrophorum subsp. funduliforme]KYM38864.1 hemin receptor [Fusobacterium necrophorum subsp. funduliforme]
MKKRLLLLAFLLSVPVLAEQTVDLGNSVVKGSKSGSGNYTLIPKEYKNTYTITQEKIRERNYKNVEDVLRDAPGVTIQHTAFGPRVDMRGSGEKSLQRVKVMVDGVSINPTEETMASLPINAIPIETVKKIEIIPGGGATLYGSGSVGGVVSITTNSNATKNNFFMDLNYGSYDHRSFGFAGGYNINPKLYVNYGFSYLNSEGYRREEEKENKIFLGGFDYKFNKKNRVRLQVRHSDIKDDSSNQLKKKELLADRTAPGLNMDTETKDKSYTLDYEYRPSENLTFVATAYQQNQKREITTESVDDIKIVASDRNYTSSDKWMYFLDVTSGMRAKFDEEKRGMKFKGKYDYKKGELLFGYDYQKSINKRKSFVSSETLKTYTNMWSNVVLDDKKPIINQVDIRLQKESEGFYAFNKWNVNKDFDFTTGFRMEKTKYKGYRKNGPNLMPVVSTEPTTMETDRKLKNYAGEVGFLYKYSDTGRAFVRYERGFVTPFANQLTDKVKDTKIKNNIGTFFIPPAVNVASKYVDNNLKSETTDTVEIGFRDYFFNSLLSTSFFLTDTTDEITLISSGVTNPAINRWKYRNIGKTRRMGIEMEAEQKFGKWTLNQSLTLINTKVLESNEEARILRGDKVPLVPRIKATLGLKYKVTDKLSLIGSYTYFSKRDTRELQEHENIRKEDKIVKHTIGGYGTVDLGVLYEADTYSNIKVGAKNLFNKKYNLRETSIEALPAPERNYYLEMNVRF